MPLVYGIKLITYYDYVSTVAIMI